MTVAPVVLIPLQLDNLHPAERTVYGSEPPNVTRYGGSSALEPDSSSVSPIPPEGQEEGIPDAPESAQFDRVPVQLERRGVSSHRQGQLWAGEIIHQRSIVAKLDSIDRGDLVGKARECHMEETVRSCTSCRKKSRFWNRCDLKWCPICAPRLSRERKESVEWWAKLLQQPKHVVLTARNREVVHKDYFKFIKAAFGKLRRTHVWSLVKGGFYQAETTWSKTDGFHVHLHVLVDARWVDARLLAQTWGRLVGQDFAVVMVKDCRGKGYIQEVTKYLVKGSDMASWPAETIAGFIEATTGVKTFGVFGSLFGKRTEWREWIAQIHAGRVQCECGCARWELEERIRWEWTETFVPHVYALPPPVVPHDARQMQFNVQ